MAGSEELSGIIARIRAFGRSCSVEVAKEAAPFVEAAIRKTAAAGTAPDGTPWQPKKDGSRPLVNAASQLFALAKDGGRLGAAVQIIAKFPLVFHNMGVGKRLPERRVLPEGTNIPQAVEEALERAATTVFARLMKGGR